MPLTEKGTKILSNMQREYGGKKGKSVFYASINAGKIMGAEGRADGGTTPGLGKLRKMMSRSDSDLVSAIQRDQMQQIYGLVRPRAAGDWLTYPEEQTGSMFDPKLRPLHISPIAMDIRAMSAGGYARGGLDEDRLGPDDAAVLVPLGHSREPPPRARSGLIQLAAEYHDPSWQKRRPPITDMPIGGRPSSGTLPEAGDIWAPKGTVDMPIRMPMTEAEKAALWGRQPAGPTRPAAAAPPPPPPQYPALGGPRAQPAPQPSVIDLEPAGRGPAGEYVYGAPPPVEPVPRPPRKPRTMVLPGQYPGAFYGIYQAGGGLPPPPPVFPIGVGSHPVLGKPGQGFTPQIRLPVRPDFVFGRAMGGTIRSHYATGGLGRLGHAALGSPQMGAMGRLAGFGTGLISKGIGLSGFKHHQQGGLADDDEEPPGQTLNDDCVHLVQSEVPGRTDRIPMTARAGSYILPADVVSGLGQGNTAAGAKMWADVLKLHMPKGRPKMPPLPGAAGGMAAGGVGQAGGEDTDIVVAGGEVVVSPECVAAIGGGDPDEGKKVLNDAVLSVREQVQEHSKSLPGPVQ